MTRARKRGAVYVQNGLLYVWYYDRSGKRVRASTGFRPGQMAEARAYLNATLAKLDAGVDVATGGPLTLRSFAEKWVEARSTRVRSVGQERSRLRLYVYPRLGDRALDDIRPRDIGDLIEHLKVTTSLAPRTLHAVYSVLHRLFSRAKYEGHIDSNPCELPTDARILPAREDADPEWRPNALFTRAELETLISDERIPEDRRLLYALKGIACLRHGEAAGLRWRDYDPDTKPLGRLNVVCSYARKGTKTGVTRAMPVHRVLARLLASWKLSGWEAKYGRHATPEDLIVPNEVFKPRERGHAQELLVADLRVLGLRVKASQAKNRGGHDLRATGITLYQEDGAAAHIIERGTHGARKGDVFGGYSRFPFHVIAAEVEKLRVDLKEGRVLAMPVAAGGRGPVTRLVTESAHHPENKPSATGYDERLGGVTEANPGAPSARLRAVGTQGRQPNRTDPVPGRDNVTDAVDHALADLVEGWRRHRDLPQLRHALGALLKLASE